MMTTIAVRDLYLEVLAPFGNVQDMVDLALQRLSIEQITTRIAELRQRDIAYRKRYGMDYPTFVARSASDEQFVTQMEATISKTWEKDLADWEYCYEGALDWTRRLQSILLG